MISIHHPVLDGFGDVAGGDILLSGEIGDRPSNFEDPIIGPGAKTELGNGHFKEFFRILVNRAKSFDLSRTHLGVGKDSLPLKPQQLSVPGRGDPSPDLCGALPFHPGNDIPEFHLGDVHLDIDPI